MIKMAEWKKPNKKMGEDGTISDEEIAALQPDAEEMQEEYQEYKTKKIEGTLSVRDRLARHKKRVFTLEVDLGDGGEPLQLKVRRITEKERAKFDKVNFAKYNSLADLSAEELRELNDQGYAIMAELIIDPDMSVEEWKEEVDKPTLDFISNKVALMTSEMNDAVIIEEFKKK